MRSSRCLACSFVSISGSISTDQLLMLGTVLLEEQRNSAWAAFRDRLPELADRPCWDQLCPGVGTGLTFSAAVAGKTVSQDSAKMRWPPYSKFLSLRASLAIAHNNSDVTVKFYPQCPHQQSDQIMVRGHYLRSLCQDVSKIACGICLACLKEHSTVDEHCKHRASLELWVENDSLIQ